MWISKRREASCTLRNISLAVECGEKEVTEAEASYTHLRLKARRSTSYRANMPVLFA